MNYRIFCFLVALSTGVLPLWGQHLGTSLNLGLRKTFYFSEKNLWVLRQQVQLNPEIERLNNQYGDYFNEEGFWLIPDRYEAPDDDAAPDDDDEPDDDDGTPGNGNPPFFPELNDDPTRVMVEWRSTTSTVFTHKIRPWLRLNSAYAFFYNGDDRRHTLRTELDYRVLKQFFPKSKWDISVRSLVQRIGQRDDGALEWATFWVPRFDVEWKYRPRHTLAISQTVNGVLDGGQLEFDRWRVACNLQFDLSKKHRYTFGYQYQQRLDQPVRSHTLQLSYEIRL